MLASLEFGAAVSGNRARGKNAKEKVPGSGRCAALERRAYQQGRTRTPLPILIGAGRPQQQSRARKALLPSLKRGSQLAQAVSLSASSPRPYAAET